MDKCRRYVPSDSRSAHDIDHSTGNVIIRLRLPWRFPVPSSLTPLLTNSLSPLHFPLDGRKISYLTSSGTASSINLQATARDERSHPQAGATHRRKLLRARSRSWTILEGAIVRRFAFPERVSFSTYIALPRSRFSELRS